MKLEINEWESSHFGFIIATLTTSLMDYNLEKINAIVKRKKIDLIQTNIPVNAVDLIQILESDGFRFSDIKTEYYSPVNPSKCKSPEITIASLDDLDEITEIAEKSIKYSRYFNKFFDRARADLLYKIWVEKSIVSKFDDVCLIHRENNSIKGFVTLKKTDKKTGRIGLIAVKDDSQNSGIGSRLLSQCRFWQQHNGIDILTVVTQGANITAQNFYQKNNFKIDLVSCWLYKPVAHAE